MLFCAVFSRIRRLRRSPQYLLAILLGEVAVSADLRNSPQNFQSKSADKCQSPGSWDSLGWSRGFRTPPKREVFGRADDTVGNPHRAQTYEFDFFELILLFNLDKRFPVVRFEATLSQSTVPSPPLKCG